MNWFFPLIFSVFFLQLPVFSQGTTNELLWEISGKGIKAKSYLYGSLHSNDKRVFRFQDSLYQALNSAQQMVLETDIFSMFTEWDTRKEEVKLLYDSDGNPYTGTARATKTKYGDEDGMPQFLDAWFQQYAYNTGKQFVPLETVEEQLGLLDGFNIRSSSDQLTEMVNNYVQQQMLEIYLDGDIKSLDKIMRTTLKAYPDAYEEFIVARNKKMAEGLDTLLAKGSLFCAVGAGHLYGEQGIIQLLRKKGYKLRCVTAIYSEDPDLKKEVRSANKYTLTDPAGFKAVFPGKPMEETLGSGNRLLVYREMGQGNTYSIEIIPYDVEYSLNDYAAIYIASPGASPARCFLQDDGTETCQGISDSYPEGLHWIRILRNEKYLIVAKAYGGNKFMNSNRPELFFDRITIE
jgi:uncharacterized protein YbaP (TraB family)